MKRRGRIVLAALTLLVVSTTCGDYPEVTVVNETGGPVRDVAVILEEGLRYEVGRLGENQRTTIVVEPEGESHLTVVFVDADDGLHRTTGGYFEEGGGYHLTLRLREDGEVDFKTDFAY